jgi:transcriptional regulator GlxA family with amidase domain
MAIQTVVVKQWIHENVRRIRTIDDIASALGVSAETLRKSFVREERTTLSEFIAHERVERAKSLLVSTRLKCFEIAFDAGFAREDVGARTFRRLTGETMGQFRSTRQTDKRRCKPDGSGSDDDGQVPFHHDSETPPQEHFASRPR